MRSINRVGSVELSLLRSLREHGSWHFNCGWVWDTGNGTDRRLRRLAEKGYVHVQRQVTPSRDVFTLTPKGAKLAAYGRHKVCP